jgi:hypothetical protein
MKNLIITCLTLCIVLVFSACYKETNWLDENVTTEGKFFPNITFNTLDSTAFTRGGSVRCNLEYWSKDKIKEIRIYDSIGTTARKVVATIPYAAAYSAFKKSDTLIYMYTVPTTATAGSTIRLDAQAVNDNGLTKLSGRLSFTVK